MMTKEEFYTLLAKPRLMNQESAEALRQLVDNHPAFQTAWILYLKNLMMLEDPAFETELKRAAVYIQNRRALYLYLHRELEQEEYFEVFDDSEKTEKADMLEIDYTSSMDYQLEDSRRANEEMLSDLVESFRKKTLRKANKSLVEQFLADEPLIELDMPVRAELEVPKEKEKEIQREVFREEPEEQPAPKPQPKAKVQQPLSAEKEDFVSETLAHIYARQGYYDRAIEVFEKLSLKYPEKNIYFAGQIEKIKKLKNN